MIRRLVDWCVPSKALRLGTPKRTLLLRIAAMPIADGERLMRDIREGLIAIGTGATQAGSNLMRLGAAMPTKRHPRPLRAAGR